MESHRQILKSSLVIGGASGVKILMAVFRVKVLAVLLGPGGLGILGIYQNLLSFSTTVAGCGVSTSGVQRLAAEKDRHEVVAEVSAAIFYTNLLLGLLAASFLWLAREPLSYLLSDGEISAADIGWLGVGVILSLMAAAHTTLLHGLRKIRELATITIVGSMLATVFGVFFVLQFGRDGIVWFVLSVPAIALIVSHVLCRRLNIALKLASPVRVFELMRFLVGRGSPLMIAEMINIGTLLIARTYILREMGIEASGHFEAAWLISMTYLGFVFTSMGADYYPRLAGLKNNPSGARLLVRQQTEMGLLLAGAMIVAVVSLSPLVIKALYSAEFSATTEILRWQMLGNVIKLLGWPMGFVVLASGKSMLFVYTQSVWNVVFLLCLFFLTPLIGLKAVGVGFALAFFVGAVNVCVVAKMLIGAVHSRGNVIFGTVLLISVLVVIVLSSWSEMSSIIVGMVLALLIGVYSIFRLDVLTGFLDELLRRKT